MLYVRSDKDAPNRKVIAVDLAVNDSARRSIATIVPEAKETMDTVKVIGDRIVGLYLVDVQSRLKQFDLRGQPQGEVALPGVGSVGELVGRTDEPDVWYNFSSPLTPVTVYAFDPQRGASAAFEAANPPVDVSAFETKAMFAMSKDGTRVPFFLTAKKNLPLDGNNPTMLYGYGGFSVTTLPGYVQSVPAWLERGGVWVTASMRGGSEYGETWHEQGMLARKQTTFDDMVAVAEWLIAQKYTVPAKLAIEGGSNGGLLMGAALTQRPDVFRAVVSHVGIYDMLRAERSDRRCCVTSGKGCACIMRAMVFS